MVRRVVRILFRVTLYRPVPARLTDLHAQGVSRSYRSTAVGLTFLACRGSTGQLQTNRGQNVVSVLYNELVSSTGMQRGNKVLVISKPRSRRLPNKMRLRILQLQLQFIDPGALPKQPQSCILYTSLAPNVYLIPFLFLLPYNQPTLVQTGQKAPCSRSSSILNGKLLLPSSNAGARLLARPLVRTLHSQLVLHHILPHYILWLSKCQQSLIQHSIV